MHSPHFKSSHRAAEAIGRCKDPESLSEYGGINYQLILRTPLP